MIGFLAETLYHVIRRALNILTLALAPWIGQKRHQPKARNVCIWKTDYG